MRFKIFSFILTMFFVSSAYSADIDAKLSPEITEQIARQFDSQNNGFETNIGEFKIKKIQDPTAEHQILLKEIEEKIDADLEKQHYSASGDYVILVHQPIEGQNIYRVISFKVTVEGDKSNVDNIKEIALIELVEAVVTEDRVHNSETPVVENEVRIHEQTEVLVGNARTHEHFSDSNSVSALAAPSEDVLGGTHLENRGQEGAGGERVHNDDEPRLHQEPEQTQMPDMDAP